MFRKSKQLPCWKLLFPKQFFVFTESSFSQRRLLNLKGGGRSCSGLLNSYGPDDLCEVARNYHKIIFNFCALNLLHTKLCKLPVALRSWNISWKLQSKIVLALRINICVYFSSHALQADIWEEIGMGRYILPLLWDHHPLCWMPACRTTCSALWMKFARSLNAFAHEHIWKSEKVMTPFKIKMELLAGRKGTTLCS